MNKRIILTGLALALFAASAAHAQQAASSTPAMPIKGGGAAPSHPAPAKKPAPAYADRDCHAEQQAGKPPLKVCAGR
jgi:hypothetical protein